MLIFISIARFISHFLSLTHFFERENNMCEEEEERKQSSFSLYTMHLDTFLKFSSLIAESQQKKEMNFWDYNLYYKSNGFPFLEYNYGNLVIINRDTVNKIFYG